MKTQAHAVRVSRKGGKTDIFDNPKEISPKTCLFLNNHSQSLQVRLYKCMVYKKCIKMLCFGMANRAYVLIN